MNNKQGSYLVEAALILPIFILAVWMMLSAIPACTASENVAFAVSDELRLESAKTPFVKEPATMKLRIDQRVATENPNISGFRILDTKYLYSKDGIDDLISMEYRFDYEGSDIQTLFRKAVFSEKMTVRAFTGKVHTYSPDSRTEISEEIVYVFPNWGMRYHDKSCTYIKGSCQMVYLTSDIKKQYQNCKRCNAKSAQIGSPVFCFTRYGEVYHVSGCTTVDRYYVTMERHKAVSQGYTPCTKCGG